LISFSGGEPQNGLVERGTGIENIGVPNLEAGLSDMGFAWVKWISMLLET
jgi:hypothetical protein